MSVPEHDYLAGNAAFLAPSNEGITKFVRVMFGEQSLERGAQGMYNLKLRCKDKKVCAVLRAAQNTLAQNAVDILTDCPSRERAGWLCDGYFSGKAERILSGKNDAEKAFLENYALAPQSPYLPEGMIPMCYPGNIKTGILFRIGLCGI